MSWLKKDLALLGRTAEEEFYEALARSPDPQQPAGAGGGSEQGEWLDRSEEGSQSHGLALHRAAYNGDLAELRRLLAGLSLRQKLQLDTQGNTALHVAVLRHQYYAIPLLLDAGIPADVKNARLWLAIDEAVALRDAQAAKMLYTRLLADAKLAKREKKAALVAIMRDQLPDFAMQLRWELGSPLFGLLLRHYAPDDTYQLWKVGDRLRVDGTLMGLDDAKRSFIPRWKRGHFSLLVDAGVSPTAALLVDHTTRTYYDLYKERKAHLKGVDVEVSEMIAGGAGKVRMAEGTDFEFKPVKTWLGRQATEKVDGWEAEVHEVSGTLVAATWQKAAVVLPPGASFEEYLDMQLPADEVEEVPLDPLDPPDKPKPAQPRPAAAAAVAPAAAPAVAVVAGGASGGTLGGSDYKRASFGSSSTFVSASSGEGGGGDPPSDYASASGSSHGDSRGGGSGGGGGGSPKAGGKKKQKAKAKPKVFSSRCWLARGYPISLAHMIPLLEVVAADNKHFAQAALYLRQFQSDKGGQGQLFPVKVQIPLMWTVYLMLAFRRFTLLGPSDAARAPAFFQIPTGYTLDHMEEGDIVGKKAEPLLQRLDSGEVPPATPEA